MSFDKPPVPQYGPPQPEQHGQQPLAYNGAQPGMYGQPPVKRPTDPLAIWGFVCAFVFWPAGLVLSIIAGKRIKATGAEGKGLALAGLIISSVAGVVSIISIVVLAIAGTAAVNSADDLAAALAEPPSDMQTPAADADPDALGSRTNPVAYGDWLQFGNEAGTAVEWEVSIAAPLWDATAKVAEDEYNDAAPAGQVYVVVPVSSKNDSTEGKTPWMETNVKFVSADGRSFDSTQISMDGDVMDLGDLYEGGEATGTMVFLLPTDALTGGTWSVSYGFADAETFVAAL